MKKVLYILITFIILSNLNGCINKSKQGENCKIFDINKLNNNFLLSQSNDSINCLLIKTYLNDSTLHIEKPIYKLMSENDIIIRYLNYYNAAGDDSLYEYFSKKESIITDLINNRKVRYYEYNIRGYDYLPTFVKWIILKPNNKAYVADYVSPPYFTGLQIKEIDIPFNILDGLLNSNLKKTYRFQEDANDYYGIFCCFFNNKTISFSSKGLLQYSNYYLAVDTEKKEKGFIETDVTKWYMDEKSRLKYEEYDENLVKLSFLLNKHQSGLDDEYLKAQMLRKF